MNGKLLPTAGLVIVLVAGALTAGSAAAQEMEPKKWDNLEWYQMINVSFEQGKVEEALGIIEDYFMKAAQQAGTPGPDMVFLNHTGEWDMTILWKMKGGISDMEWEMSPDDAKWMKAMAELTGGPDKALAKWQEYLALVVDSETEIVRAWNPGGGGE